MHMRMNIANTLLNDEIFRIVIISLATIPTLLYIGWVMKNAIKEFLKNTKEVKQNEERNPLQH